MPQIVSPVVFLVIDLSFLTMLYAVFGAVVFFAATILIRFFHNHKLIFSRRVVKENHQKTKIKLDYFVFSVIT